VLPELKPETAKTIMKEEEGIDYKKYLKEFESENPTLASMCIIAELSGNLCTPVVALLYHMLKVQGEIDELEKSFKV